MSVEDLTDALLADFRPLIDDKIASLNREILEQELGELTDELRDRAVDLAEEVSVEIVLGAEAHAAEICPGDFSSHGDQLAPRSQEIT